MPNEDFLNQIVNEIFQITSPKIDGARNPQIKEFIKITINGDTTKAYLVVDVALQGKPGIFVYVLTNARLIQFEIGAEEEIKSASFLLNTIIGVERKLIEGDNRTEVKVNFPRASVGLKYNGKNQKITQFFQIVEQSWVKGT